MEGKSCPAHYQYECETVNGTGKAVTHCRFRQRAYWADALARQFEADEISEGPATGGGGVSRGVSRGVSGRGDILGLYS